MHKDMIKNMKYVCFLLMLMLGSALLNSCEVDSSDNGDLDGFWHLESVDTLATGGRCDYSNQRVFWGVQYKLLTVNNYKGGSFNFRFRQTSDSLILSSPYKNHGHQDVENGGDIPITEINETLRQCGINHLVESYYKEKLSGNKMILLTKDLRLNFKKF